MLEGLREMSASALLHELRTARAEENAAAARQLDLAATWADLHPPESIHSAASVATAAALAIHVSTPATS